MHEKEIKQTRQAELERAIRMVLLGMKAVQLVRVINDSCCIGMPFKVPVSPECAATVLRSQLGVAPVTSISATGTEENGIVTIHEVSVPPEPSECALRASENGYYWAKLKSCFSRSDPRTTPPQWLPVKVEWREIDGNRVLFVWSFGHDHSQAHRVLEYGPRILPPA